MNRFQDLMNGNYELNSVQHIKEALTIFKQRPAGFIGFTILFYVGIILLSVIPGVNYVTSFLSAILMVGFYLVSDKIKKGEQVEFGHFFGGFKDDYVGQVLLSAAVSGFVTIVFAIPFGIAVSFSRGTVSADDTIAHGFIFLMVILFFLVILYITIAWLWSTQFILFHKMKFWDAMETSRKITTKNFFQFLGFILLLTLFNLCGMLALGVGLLFTIPVSTIAVYSSFDAVVGAYEPDPQDELMKHLIE